VCTVAIGSLSSGNFFIFKAASNAPSAHSTAAWSKLICFLPPAADGGSSDRQNGQVTSSPNYGP
jgi:hypothetical protein